MTKNFGRPARTIPCLLALLAALPASVVSADIAPAGDVELARWSREEASPRLLAELESSPNDHSRNLAALLRSSLDTDGAAHFPVHDARFWAAAVESREATHRALAVRLLALAADGNAEAAARYTGLIRRFDGSDTVASELLGELARRVPASIEAESDIEPSALRAADAALDTEEYALAALGYRAVLLDAPPEEYAFRDIPGHYFYCLDALGASPNVVATRTRFNRTVAFPSVEAQSLARIAASGDAPHPATASAN